MENEFKIGDISTLNQPSENLSPRTLKTDGEGSLNWAPLFMYESTSPLGRALDGKFEAQQQLKNMIEQFIKEYEE